MLKAAFQKLCRRSCQMFESEAPNSQAESESAKADAESCLLRIASVAFP